MGLALDNDTPFINHHLIEYSEKEHLEFTRSRPNRKNDNAYIEQKNWTHVRKMVGYLRYDTDKELTIMNSLYENELRLYKNFFSPVMKLKKKDKDWEQGKKTVRHSQDSLPKTHRIRTDL